MDICFPTFFGHFGSGDIIVLFLPNCINRIEAFNTEASPTVSQMIRGRTQIQSTLNVSVLLMCCEDVHLFSCRIHLNANFSIGG